MRLVCWREQECHFGGGGGRKGGGQPKLPPEALSNQIPLAEGLSTP